MTDRVTAPDHHHRGDRLARPPGHRGELFHREGRRPRLAEDPAFEGNELVAADDRGPGLNINQARRLGQGQLLGQEARRNAGFRPLDRRLVAERVIERHAQPIEQVR